MLFTLIVISGTSYLPLNEKFNNEKAECSVHKYRRIYGRMYGLFSNTFSLLDLSWFSVNIP